MGEWISCVAFSVLLIQIDLDVVCSVPSTGTKQRKLLLISLDGFRHDYLDIARRHNVNTSAFDKIITMGFRILRVENEFTTRTASNHFSMVTGLHEESHGIVDNVFFDPHLNETFHFGNTTQAGLSTWFDAGGEPIWVTNQKHGHRSGVTFWPGSTAKIKGLMPSLFYPVFNTSLPLKDSIDQAILWLQENSINLALLYYHEPDSQGHKTGPLSHEVMDVIGKINHDIAYLVHRIMSVPSLKASLNVILTSDHGMSDVDKNRVIILDEFLPGYLYYSPGKDVRVLWGLWPLAGLKDKDIYVSLKGKHPAMNVYLKADIPAQLFYKHNHRIAPVVAFAQPGWLIARSNESVENLHREGDHGYDPLSSDMSSFFLAFGPDFSDTIRNSTLHSIKMVDIYPLMCCLLHLENPAQHNGSFDRIAHLLRNKNPQSSLFGTLWDQFTVLMVFCLTGFLAITVMIFACGACCHLENSPPHSARRMRLVRESLPEVALSRLRRTSDTVLPEDFRCLMHSFKEEDEEEQLSSTSRFQVDDETLLNMLHEPNSRCT